MTRVFENASADERGAGAEAEKGRSSTSGGEEWPHRKRTKEEMDLLRDEIRHATTLDLKRYFSDVDYELNISENPLVSKFEDDAVVRALWQIASRAKELGLSPGQVANILGIFETDVQDEVRETLQGERLAETFLQPPEDSRSNYIN